MIYIPIYKLVNIDVVLHLSILNLYYIYIYKYLYIYTKM